MGMGDIKLRCVVDWTGAVQLQYQVKTEYVEFGAVESSWSEWMAAEIVAGEHLWEENQEAPHLRSRAAFALRG